MSDFNVILPHRLLAPYVRYYWTLDADYELAATERVIPYGNMQWCFYRGGVSCGENRLDSKSLLCGQTTKYTDIITEGKIRIIAVVFQPCGASAFLRMPVNLLSGLKVSAEELDDRELKELESRILDTDDPGQCVCLLDRFLLNRLSPPRNYNLQRLDSVMKMIDQNRGQVSIDSLAGASCLGRKQFQRVFSEHVGMNPKEFLRTVRFQHLLSRMQHSPDYHFTRLACECGYYDQAHLISEFKTFSGYTPKEYLSLCAPYSDYFG